MTKFAQSCGDEMGIAIDGGRFSVRLLDGAEETPNRTRIKLLSYAELMNLLEALNIVKIVDAIADVGAARA